MRTMSYCWHCGAGCAASSTPARDKLGTRRLQNSLALRCGYRHSLSQHTGGGIEVGIYSEGREPGSQAGHDVQFRDNGDGETEQVGDGGNHRLRRNGVGNDDALGDGQTYRGWTVVSVDPDEVAGVALVGRASWRRAEGDHGVHKNHHRLGTVVLVDGQEVHNSLEVENGLRIDPRIDPQIGPWLHDHVRDIRHRT